MTFEALTAAGATFKKSEHSSSSSVNLGPIPISQSHKETVVFEWNLPAAASFRARFSKEGAGKKLVKLFKHEMQTGNVDFDASVYIETPDEAATRSLLENDAIRTKILDVVSAGGSIDIAGERVRYEIVDATSKDEEAMCDVIAAIMAVPAAS